MIRPEQIPQEAIAAALGNTGTLTDSYHMQRSIAAALNAWPMTQYRAWDDVQGVGVFLILPLSQEMV